MGRLAFYSWSLPSTAPQMGHLMTLPHNPVAKHCRAGFGVSAPLKFWKVPETAGCSTTVQT